MHHAKQYIFDGLLFIAGFISVDFNTAIGDITSVIVLVTAGVRFLNELKSKRKDDDKNTK